MITTTETLPLQTNGHKFPGVNEAEVMWFDGTPFVQTTLNCVVCDMYPKRQVVDKAVHALGPCPYPDGITTKITLNVTSGRIIVAADLRPVYNWDSHAVASYNSALGQAQASEAMAAIGCAYGFVLHGAGLYRTGRDSYIIANPERNEYGEPVLPEGDRLAGISGALWAYSIADFEHWKARGGDPATFDRPHTVVDVPPGTYQFVNHQGERDFVADSADTVIFTHVERIG
ncbi:hypothetical protein OG413_44945 [Streptomyces sp. NBC_01433]|uniref:hypothetical protein n=1 Tax=Streptomyces sp. NBC_01433 TaxID=2903864 RepID=UPI002255A2A3|nr:hypothetical protein [Streptomyces sp. NBC_01433]MCX4682334.1 hypothetical protein [Streptomyces sp. NBC_01433]